MDHKKLQGLNKWVPAILIPIVTILVSIVFSEIQAKVGYPLVIISFVFISITLVILTFSAYSFIISFVKKNVQDELDKKAVDIAEKAIFQYEEKRLLSERLSEKLYSLKQLSYFEEHQRILGCKLVSATIITSSFAYDSTSEYDISKHFFEIVKNNVDQGIPYEYYITDTPENRFYIEDLEIATSGKIKYHYLSDDFFFLVKNFDFTIYTVLDENDRRKVFGFMPITSLIVDSSKEQKSLYHTTISNELINALLERLHHNESHAA